jgi:hypothetical protein
MTHIRTSNYTLAHGNAMEVLTVQEATARSLDRTDYYSRGEQATRERVENIITMLAKLNQYLADKGAIGQEELRDLLLDSELTVEDHEE